METNPTPSDRLRELLHQSPRAFNRPRSTWTVNIRLRLCALQKSLGSAQGAQAQANIYLGLYKTLRMSALRLGLWTSRLAAQRFGGSCTVLQAGVGSERSCGHRALIPNML